MNFYVVFGVLATLALHSIIAEETKEAAPATTAAASDRVGSGTKSAYDGFGAKFGVSSYGAALATGGAVVVGVVVLLAIAAVISPVFGYRLCQIFSTCDTPTAIGYSADSSIPNYGSSPFTTYQKRSIEYVGPILQALNSAYEKYGHGAGLMNQNMRNINTE